jgi:hypothetical protein
MAKKRGEYDRRCRIVSVRLIKISSEDQRIGLRFALMLLGIPDDAVNGVSQTHHLSQRANYGDSIYTEGPTRNFFVIWKKPKATDQSSR